MTACIETKHGQIFSVCTHCYINNTKLETLPLDDSFSGFMICRECEKIWQLYTNTTKQTIDWREMEETYLGRQPIIGGPEPTIIVNPRGVVKGIT